MLLFMSIGLVKDTHVTHSALLCPVGFEESRGKRDLATYDTLRPFTATFIIEKI